MVSQEQVETWLLKRGFKKTAEATFVHEMSKFELFADHLKRFQSDKAGNWLLLEVTTFVDLFLEENGEILNKWHHVVGKNLSPYYQ